MKNASIIVLFILVACSKKGNNDPSIDPPINRDTIPALLPIYLGQDTIGNWQFLYTETSSDLTSQKIEFTSNTVGYITFYNSFGQLFIKKTLNGGRNWSGEVLLPNGANETKFITNDVGLIYRSTIPSLQGQGHFSLGFTKNSGTSWFQLFTNQSRQYTIIKNISIPNNNHGFGVTEEGDIIALTNVTNPSPGNVTNLGAVNNGILNNANEIHFISDKIGWVTSSALMYFNGYFGKVFKTIDGGRNWQMQRSNNEESYDYIFFSDSLNGFLSKISTKFKLCENYMYKTTDGGANWQKILIQKSDNSRVEARKVIFITPQRGFLQTTNEILETTNGGTTWFRSFKDGKVSGIDDIVLNKSSNTLFIVSGKRVFSLKL